MHAGRAGSLWWQGAGGDDAAGAAPAPRRGGVLREVRALLIGFFTSLLPGAPCQLVPVIAVHCRWCM